MVVQIGVGGRGGGGRGGGRRGGRRRRGDGLAEVVALIVAVGELRVRAIFGICRLAVVCIFVVVCACLAVTATFIDVV